MIHMHARFLITVKERWRELTDVTRKMHILRLLNATDVSDRNKRMAAVRSILYLAQGNFQFIVLITNYFPYCNSVYFPATLCLF